VPVGYAAIDTSKATFLANPPISALPKKVPNVPFVSVLIDTYNHERFIEKAIHSVLEQDFPVAEREIIVVDDGSTDRTPEIVQRFEPNLSYIRKENGGQASAFNAGIPECRGQIIASLDGDDYWLPGKLSRVTEVLSNNPAVGFVGHAIKESLPVSAGSGKAGLRRNQQVMAALASSLQKALRAQGLPTDVVDDVVEIVQAEADQFRLMLNGGAPWETVRAENKLFEVLHDDASKSQKFFRTLSMIAYCRHVGFTRAGDGWVTRPGTGMFDKKLCRCPESQP